MGKVVRAVATIALTVAVAVAAPQIAGLFFAAGTFGFAATAAVAATVLGAVGALALRALFPTPTARGSIRSTCSLGPGMVPPPLQPAMRPIDDGWRSAIFYPWERVAISRSQGDCLEPAVPGGRNWDVVDRDATIRAGDQFTFGVKDWGGWRLQGLGKFFDGIDDEGLLHYHCTNPPRRFSTGLENVRYAHRIVGTYRTRRAALAARRGLREVEHV